MKRWCANRRRWRRGLGIVEMALILACVALVMYAAVGQLGQTSSSSIRQTAEGITDPARMLQHPMLAGGSGNVDDGKGNGNNGNGKPTTVQKQGALRGKSSVSSSR